MGRRGFARRGSSGFIISITAQAGVKGHPLQVRGGHVPFPAGSLAGAWRDRRHLAVESGAAHGATPLPATLALFLLESRTENLGERGGGGVRGFGCKSLSGRKWKPSGLGLPARPSGPLRLVHRVVIQPHPAPGPCAGSELHPGPNLKAGEGAGQTRSMSPRAAWGPLVTRSHRPHPPGKETRFSGEENGT